MMTYIQGKYIQMKWYNVHKVKKLLQSKTICNIMLVKRIEYKGVLLYGRKY
jgi:hypothetical protein